MKQEKNKIITAKNLELGQMVFGNPVGKFECPEYVEAMVNQIFEEISRIYWNNNQKEWERHEDPNLKGIEYRSYYWGEDEKEASKPNFSYGGVQLRWYKYFGRSMTLNVSKTPDEWVSWFNDCMEHIRKQDKSLLA